jgi:hypothetical protein
LASEGIGMNKREAKFIMQLPDGYEWNFIDDGRFLCGASPDKEILLYEIVNDELVKRELKFKEA